MNKDKKTIIFPGFLHVVKTYDGYDAVSVWNKNTINKPNAQANYFVGHSLGASFLLSSRDFEKAEKIILVNPLIKSRSFLDFFFRLLRFLFVEGVDMRRVLPIEHWFYSLRIANRLLKFDMLEVIKNIPKDKIIVIRGKRDSFFCDNEIVEILKDNNIPLIEINAGHDWNEDFAKTVHDIIY